MKGSGSLKELVELLVKSLVDRTEAVSVEKMENSGSILFEVSVHPDELGKVIGKQGRVIKPSERWSGLVRRPGKSPCRAGRGMNLNPWRACGRANTGGSGGGGVLTTQGTRVKSGSSFNR